MKTNIKYYLILKQLPLDINTCHIYVGFTTMTNDDIQQGSIGISTCAVDMLSALPIDKGEILFIAHNSDYDCSFIIECLQNVKPIVKSYIFFTD